MEATPNWFQTSWDTLDTPWKVSVVAISVILLLLLLSMLFKPQPYSSNLKELVRQSAQLYEMARQDKDPAIALQHASESIAILSVVRHLAADSVIEHASGVKVSELAALLSSFQASCIAALSQHEPTASALAAGYAKL